MSLPNPNMVFVPLDILTAEEMNQIVENIEYVDKNATFPISQSDSGNVIDIGAIRVQWGFFTWSGLNTGAKGYNSRQNNFPQPFKDDNAYVNVELAADPLNVSGSTIIVYERTATSYSVNYNHIEPIERSTVRFQWFAVGLKP